MKKIALVIPYIGKFRPDFSIFLHSCRNNPTVDFLFFCDNFDSCYFDMCVGGGIYMLFQPHWTNLKIEHKFYSQTYRFH